MNDIFPTPEDRDFLRRLSSRVPEDSIHAMPRRGVDDALPLAIWLDGNKEDTDSIEAILAEDPQLLAESVDIWRELGSSTDVPEPLLAKLEALDPSARANMAPSLGNVVTFRARQTVRRVGLYFAWGAVAASVVIVSLVSFNLGSSLDTQQTVQSAAATDNATSMMTDDID